MSQRTPTSSRRDRHLAAPNERAVARIRREYVDLMFEGSEHLIRDVSEHDLLLVATAHCLSANDYERALDFAAVLAERRRQACAEPDTAAILPLQTSSRGSN